MFGHITSDHPCKGDRTACQTFLIFDSSLKVVDNWNVGNWNVVADAAPFVGSFIVT